MTRCAFTATGQDDRGRFTYKCQGCGQVVHSRRNVEPASITADCTTPESWFHNLGFSSADIERVKKRHTLLGDAIAALTRTIGLPPCSNCESRKEWLNKAHAWILGCLR